MSKMVLNQQKSWSLVYILGFVLQIPGFILQVVGLAGNDWLHLKSSFSGVDIDFGLFQYCYLNMLNYNYECLDLPDELVYDWVKACRATELLSSMSGGMVLLLAGLYLILISRGRLKTVPLHLATAVLCLIAALTASVGCAIFWTQLPEELKDHSVLDEDYTTGEDPILCIVGGLLSLPAGMVMVVAGLRLARVQQDAEFAPFS